MERRLPAALAVRLLALALALPFTSGCGLFGAVEDLGSISIPLTFDLPGAYPIAYPSAEQFEQLQSQGEVTFPIQFYVPVDIAGIDSRIPSTDVVQEVRVSGITMNVVQNTLQTPLEPIEFRIGTSDASFDIPGTRNQSYESALPIGVTDQIPVQDPTFTGPVEAMIVADNQSQAGQLIADLDFGVGIGTELVIPEGNIPGGGAARVEFTLELQFVVSPF